MWFSKILAFWKKIPASVGWSILACLCCLALGAGISHGYYKSKLDSARADLKYYKDRNAIYDGYARSELRQLIDDNRTIGSQLEQYQLNSATALTALQRAVTRSTSSLALISKYGSIAQQNEELYREARRIVADIREAVRPLAGEIGLTKN